MYVIPRWHLGFCKRAYLPTNRGFDTFFGKYLGGGDHYLHISEPTGEMLSVREN